MAHSTSSKVQKGHLVLSNNLLKLLQWIVDHEAEALKQLVVRAVENRFSKKYALDEELIELHIADETLQQSVLEFLSLMDTLLTETTQDHTANRFVQRNLLPILDHLDSAICDDAIVQTSIERASSRLNSQTNGNLQELVLQEILKRWKPAKKETLN